MRSITTICLAIITLTTWAKINGDGFHLELSDNSNPHRIEITNYFINGDDFDGLFDNSDRVFVETQITATNSEQEFTDSAPQVTANQTININYNIFGDDGETIEPDGQPIRIKITDISYHVFGDDRETVEPDGQPIRIKITDISYHVFGDDSGTVEPDGQPIRIKITDISYHVFGDDSETVEPDRQPIRIITLDPNSGLTLEDIEYNDFEDQTITINLPNGTSIQLEPTRY